MSWEDESDFSPQVLGVFDKLYEEIEKLEKSTEIKPNVPPKPVRPFLRSQRSRAPSGTQTSRVTLGVLKLTRATSLGRLCGDIVSSQLTQSRIRPSPQASTSIKPRENDPTTLAAKLDQLQVAYDTKCGEYAALKKSSTQSTKSRLETIRRLETQLAQERAKASKLIDSLKSQLAFRDADYRLVSTELTQCKIQLAALQSNTSNPDDFYLGSSQFPNDPSASPASMMLTQFLDAVDSKCCTKSSGVGSIGTTSTTTATTTTTNSPAGRLPRRISPVVTRRGKRSLDESLSDSDGFADAISPSPKRQRPLPPSTHAKFEVPKLDLEEAVREPSTPEKRPPAVLEKGTSPPTSLPPPETASEAGESASDSEASLSSDDLLKFRLKKTTTATEVCRTVAGQLSQLASKMQALGRDPQLPHLSISEASQEEQSKAQGDFFSSLYQLTLGDDAVDKCLSQILPLIRLRSREYLNFFRLFRLGVFDHSFRAKLFEGDTSGSDDNDDKDPIEEKLSKEHPFVGAPASQLISLPSLDSGRPIECRPIEVKPKEPSTWLECTAEQTLGGLLACLSQVEVLFNALRNQEDADMKSLAVFINEMVTGLASMLSMSVEDPEEDALNAIPPLWMAKLARVIEEALLFSSKLVAKLEPDESDALPQWQPPLMSMFVLVACVMTNKTTLKEPTALIPALNVLTTLLETGHLDALKHPVEVSEASSSSSSQKSWWSSSGEDEGFELLERLAQLEASLVKRNVTYRTIYTFPYISQRIPPSEQIGCPLLLLCRFVRFELSTLGEDDVGVHSRLIIEFGRFVNTLAANPNWERYLKCACTIEIYRTLVSMGMRPVEWLSKPWAFSEELKYLCFSAMGSLVVALNSLLLAHGDDFFQKVTDRLPGFFTIVVTLDRLRDAPEAELFHPEVVEELFDFDDPNEVPLNKSTSKST